MKNYIWKKKIFYNFLILNFDLQISENILIKKINFYYNFFFF
jgi:hypothetical protein